MENTMIFFISLILIMHQVKSENVTWNVEFSSKNLTIEMSAKRNENFTISLGQNYLINDYFFKLKSTDDRIATMSIEEIKPIMSSKIFRENFTIKGNSIGRTKIYMVLVRPNVNENERSSAEIDLIVTLRKETIWNTLFNSFIAILVSLLYINFGCALDLDAVKNIMLRPIGPVIGFTCQFILMPLLSYFLGSIIFPNDFAMQLGLFFIGISPGGGASNIWTVILQGNINLSIAMTTISTFAAFGTMPLWIYLLGSIIFEDGDLGGVPYDKIAIIGIGLIIPLTVGVLIQKYFTNVTKFLIKMIKPISIIFIVFISIFGIILNYHLFQLFSWKMTLASLALPFLGYTSSWCIAKLFNLDGPDALTVSIEVGIQNIGIALFLIKFTLEPPLSDLITLVPITVAMMTPLPLILLFFLRKYCSGKNKKKQNKSASKAKNVLLKSRAEEPLVVQSVN